MLSAAVAVVAGALSGALWGGFVDGVVVDGGRAPGEIQEALRVVAPAFAGCVAGDGAAGGFDVVVEVKIGAAGSVLGTAAVILSPGARERLNLVCVQQVVEPLALKDRGREPATHVLLRFTDVVGVDGAPPPLPLADLKRALKKRQGDVARCVTRARRLQPNLRGTVVARLLFDGDGDLVEADYDGLNAVLSGCVRTGLAGLVVPGFPGPRQVVAPFVFDDVDLDPLGRPAGEHRSLASFLGCDPLLP